MMSATKIYQKWKASDPAIACRFARLIALNPSRYGQQVVEITKRGTAQEIADQIDRTVAHSIASNSGCALALLFPKIDSLELWACALFALGSFVGWDSTVSQVSVKDDDDYVTLRLRRWITRSDGILVPSEALALGPFTGLPATRQSPITALELLFADAKLIDPKDGQPTDKANLAHIGLPMISQEFYERNWNRTVDARLKSLGGVDDPRAKAKVTLSLSKSDAQSFGIF